MKKILILITAILCINSSVQAYTQNEALYYLQKSNIPANSKGLLLNSITQGDIETAKLLIDAKQIDLNERYLGSTYLIQAVYSKQDDIALYLLENGANPQIKTVDGGSALFFAVKNGQTKVVEKMLETPGINIKRHRMFFRLPLKTTAKRNGYTEIYNMLDKYQKEYEASKK
ncbi:MAG: ankyrin repeat domain-containing protein [Clostridium sp.]|nr:ankyrin repeat domain-containing protein [Clostridium sp.]